MAAHTDGEQQSQSTEDKTLNESDLYEEQKEKAIEIFINLNNIFSTGDLDIGLTWPVPKLLKRSEGF